MEEFKTLVFTLLQVFIIPLTIYLVKIDKKIDKVYQIISICKNCPKEQR